MESLLATQGQFSMFSPLGHFSHSYIYIYFFKGILFLQAKIFLKYIVKGVGCNILNLVVYFFLFILCVCLYL